MEAEWILTTAFLGGGNPSHFLSKTRMLRILSPPHPWNDKKHNRILIRGSLYGSTHISLQPS